MCWSVYLEPASIHTPTVHVSPGSVSDATRTPFDDEDTSNLGAMATLDSERITCVLDALNCRAKCLTPSIAFWKD